MTRHPWTHGVEIVLVLLCALAGMNPVGCGDDDDNSSSSAGADDDAATADDDSADDDLADDDASDDDAVDDDAIDDDTADDDTGGCVDIDGDGYGENCPAGDDCWDFDATKWEMIHPYRDADYDTYPGTPTFMCAGMPLPNGWSMTSTDCDDADPAVNPGMFDFPDDGIDNDCVSGDVATSSLNVIYVDGAGGDDANPGTALLPMKTMNAGIAAATLGGADGVVVATGTYNEDLVTTVSLFGGYDAGTWTRDLSSTAPVTRVEPAAADTTILVDGAVGPMAVNGFTVQPSAGVIEVTGVEVSESGDVWISDNVVLRGTAERTAALSSHDSGATFVNNDLEMGGLVESFGVEITGSTADREKNEIISNRIFGDVESLNSIIGISSYPESRVIGNEIELNAYSQFSAGILATFSDLASSDESCRPDIASNKIYMTGVGVAFFGGILTGGYSYPEIGESVTDNKITMVITAFGGTGIFSSIAASNNIEIQCQSTLKAMTTGLCSGIMSRGLGYYRQNVISIHSERGAGSDAAGILVQDMVTGDVNASILDNTIFVSGQFGASIGVWLVSIMFLPKDYSTLHAEIFNNNIAMPPSSTPLSFSASEVYVDTWNNNLFSGYLTRFTPLADREVRNGDFENNISVNPKFVDAENGNLRLRSDSPLIDAGLYEPRPSDGIPAWSDFLDEEWNLLPRDLDGTRRPKGAAMDIGADEYEP